MGPNAIGRRGCAMTSVTDVEQLLDELLRREGGYVDDPRDAGGETHWGITIEVARADGYSGPMRDLPRERAKAIYRQRYWTRPNFDAVARLRSEEHTYELQSLLRISYAVFCLKK